MSLGPSCGKGILLVEHYSKNKAKRKLHVKKKQVWARYEGRLSDRIVIEEINPERRECNLRRSSNIIVLWRGLSRTGKWKR